MFVKINERALRASNPTLKREQITIAYTEIDRLQELVNNLSAEVLQLTTERQNQQLAHGTCDH